MKKLDVLDTKVSKKEKVKYTVDGETLLDNQDVCIMLNVSKRTLQRYRSSGELPFKQIKRKTYYLDSDVHILSGSSSKNQEKVFLFLIVNISDFC
jgi:hypothetical protein